MAEFHFVEDYKKYVAFLVKKHPIDEAMSLAVGGSYDRIGSIECSVMRYAGLQSGQKIVDFGCGSGRLAVHLAQNFDVSYLGLDVVKQLIDYARTKTPPYYEYQLNNKLSFPVDDASVDWFSAFSIFTHLLHTESFIYLEDMFRCLVPGGKVVASFLEFSNEAHWTVFETTINQQRNSTTPHLNQFIERNQFELWSRKIGFSDIQFIDGSAAPWESGGALGQSIAMLTK